MTDLLVNHKETREITLDGKQFVRLLCCGVFMKQTSVANSAPPADPLITGGVECDEVVIVDASMIILKVCCSWNVRLLERLAIRSEMMCIRAP